ncbi:MULTISPECIES: hypothetical protein [Methylobacterium]|jgi:hypothetical protein|uniref:TonB C-terminal domain-containing protein n=1 Tax=Methylobacterium brachiatum TaxID=269660 RepID=A0AAJ1TTT1_9HYPH|nr:MULTISPECIES: hypothetical protein [Methylobacterium]MDH2312563.1 hypothetical protein [Methylobacterium brachiatum]MDQ0546836.1 hypothetical protein [Methylobacterium brachiatum]
MRAVIRTFRMRGVLLALAAVPMPAWAEPANTLPELWRALGACTRVKNVPAAALGSEVTVLFSLKRDGSLQGQPRITHSHLIGGPDEQQAFVSAALSGIATCFPVPVTSGLGGAIAGRLFRLRILSWRPERAIQTTAPYKNPLPLYVLKASSAVLLLQLIPTAVGSDSFLNAGLVLE